MDIKYGKRSKICQNCGETFSIRAVIDGELKSLQLRKNCLTCSPYKQNKRAAFRLKDVGGVLHKQCTKCKQFKPAHADHYVFDKTIDKYKSECKACVAQRARNYKLRAVEYKGSKCEDCKGQFPACAYDFHHLDPAEKDFMIGKAGGDWEKIKPELDKCVLLCAVCHRIRHANNDAIA